MHNQLISAKWSRELTFHFISNLKRKIPFPKQLLVVNKIYFHALNIHCHIHSLIMTYRFVSLARVYCET